MCTLCPALADHSASGLASTLLFNKAGRQLLREALALRLGVRLDDPTLPADKSQVELELDSELEPDLSSIGRRTDARRGCVICKNVNNDAWHATDAGLVCHSCLACKRWWHLGCLSASADERDTTELADPNGLGRTLRGLRRGVYRRHGPTGARQ